MRNYIVISFFALTLKTKCYKVENSSDDIIPHRSNTREGRGLFTLFYIEKTIKSFVTRIEELEQSAQSQASKIEQLEQKLSKLDNIDTAGGLQSYDGAQAQFDQLFARVFANDEKIKVNRQKINTKCSKKKCDRILNNLDKLETSVDFLQDTNITILEQMVDMIKNSSAIQTVVSLQNDVDTLDACLSDPTSTDCTSVYSSASSLPSVLAAKCDQTTCTSLSNDLTAISSCMTDPSSSTCTSSYGGASTLPSVLSGKCDGATCTTLSACMTDPTSATCTGTYGGAATLPSVVAGKCDGATCTTLEACMTDPTSASCTGTYGGAATLPSVVAGKCDGATCTPIAACMTDPTSAACTGTYGGATTLPSVVAGKCDGATCTPLAACMTDPTSASCTGTYGGAATLPSVVAGKCDSTTCTPLAACMTDPTSAGCTGTYGGAATLPSVVAGKCNQATCTLLDTCMKTPADASCTITDATSVPTLVNNLDKCMGNIDDSTCTASYGATLVSGGGSGMVAWVQQFKKPAIVNCPYTGTGLTSWLTTDADGNTPDGCDPATNYEQLTFAQCSHTEPDKTNTFHLAPTPATNTEYVEIKSDGWFKVELTALFRNLNDRRLIRADVFKISSKDPANSCAAKAQACDGLLQLRYTTLFNTASNAGDKDSDVSANNEVAVQLCSGDRILVIISKNGNLGNNVGNVFGTTETRTVLVITKLWYT